MALAMTTYYSQAVTNEFYFANHSHLTHWLKQEYLCKYLEVWRLASNINLKDMNKILTLYAAM